MKLSGDAESVIWASLAMVVGAVIVGLIEIWGQNVNDWSVWQNALMLIGTLVCMVLAFFLFLTALVVSQFGNSSESGRGRL